MKERWRISKDNLVSTEEGLKIDKVQTGVNKKRNCSFDRLIEISKLVLYITLILVLGWSSYILWNSRTIAYKHQAEIKAFDPFHSDYDATTVSEDIESSTISDGMLMLDFEDSLVNTKKDISAFNDQSNDRKTNTEVDTKSVDDLSTSLWEDLIKETAVETTATSRNVVVEDSVESLRSKEDDQAIKSQNSLDVDDYKKKESFEDRAFLDWDLPFLWSINPGHVPSAADYAKEDSDSKLDEILTDLYDSNENDDKSHDVSESRQTSYEKINQEGVEQNENNFTDDNSLSLTETINEIKKLNKLLENAKRDLVLQMTLANIKALTLLQEKSDNPFLDNSNADESYAFFPEKQPNDDYLESVTSSTEAIESEIPDISQVEDTTRNLFFWHWNFSPDFETKSSEDDTSVDPKPIDVSEETDNREKTLIAGTNVGNNGDSVVEKFPEDVNDDLTDVNEDHRGGMISFGPRMRNEADRCTTVIINNLRTIRCWIEPDSSVNVDSSSAETIRRGFEETIDMDNVDENVKNEKYDTHEDSAIDEIEREPTNTYEPSHDGMFEWQSEAVDVLGSSEDEVLSQDEDWFHLKEQIGKARECRMDSDCAGIQNTTCLADRRDGRTRCLCGDYNAPVNGACTNKFKAIRAPCNDDTECIEGAHCIVQGNNTTTGKRCYCREGYVEDNLMCSGCSSIFLFSTTLLPALTLFSGRMNYL